MSSSWQNVTCQEDASEGQPDCPNVAEKMKLFADADQLEQLRSKCPHISLQPSPSEAGELHEANALGADSGSTDIDNLMLARHVQAIRRSVAAIDKFCVLDRVSAGRCSQHGFGSHA